jgi:chemotaxis protein CheD
MPVQTLQNIEPGCMEVTANRAVILTVSNLASGVAVIAFDAQKRLAGVANIILPDSSVKATGTTAEEFSNKYADVAIPNLIQKFTELGGQQTQSIITIVGGAQMFNFGGGAGNLLNVGSRNVATIKTALYRLGYDVNKADVGGNKGKNIRLVVATGQLYVKCIGGQEYTP